MMPHIPFTNDYFGQRMIDINKKTTPKDYGAYLAKTRKGGKGGCQSKKRKK
jgi:hypothetical protein